VRLSSCRAAHMREVLGYQLSSDHSFYSYALKFKKPDPHYFLAIIRALNFEPAELLFIDDREPNILAAA